jgi:chromosome condensin MukBEF MukE localization factor
MLWFSLGIAAGVAASRKARGAARRVTPVGAAENVGDAVRELAAVVGSFGADVRAGMVQREAELHATVAQRTGMDLTPRQASTRARAASARA